MKKILALLLAVMMLASIGCAWAEGTTEEAAKYPDEITFQDIPWGSSKEEVKSWAKGKGFENFVTLGSYTEAYLDASGTYVTGMMMIGDISEDDKILQVRDNPSFQIAGYTIYGLDFHFDVQDGKTELNTVVVRFQEQGAAIEQSQESQAILDDLEQKLITVYGEYAVPATENFLSKYMSYRAGDIYRKVGAEDTAICLTNQMGNGVMLVYGKIHVPVAEEKNDTPLTIDAFNIDGL